MSYSAGKKSSIAKGGGTTASMGKRTPATFSKVGNSAGQSSGTKRTGDAQGAPAMGKGK